MLTRLTIRNFKRLAEADIDLSQSVVFIGPNNSGKTSALQALALWEAGWRAWFSKRGANSQAEKRSGVTLNRKDLIAVAVPDANLLWRDLHVRASERQDDGKLKTRNILIEICVEGVTDGQVWCCGLEFDYANTESFYCRPLRTDAEGKERMILPDARLLEQVRVAFLPPMSGLASVEPKLEPGRINVLIGEGQTAQVLRNLCLMLYDQDKSQWENLVRYVTSLFGVSLQEPLYNAVRGEVSMSYRERSGTQLDLSSAGRGLQQTLLLLAYIYANPRTVILLDEPDAHLEILRQRQIYRLINEVAEQQGCQIIAASHSEVVLNEAAEKDAVVAFIGKPHLINNKGHQVLKALNNIGFENYYMAEERGWVLYLEGSTDYDILRTFAKKINHPAYEVLEAPFVHYVGNNRPSQAREHFHGIKEAKHDLVGLAIFDNIASDLVQQHGLTELMWSKREIENYFCREDILMAWARGRGPADLIEMAEASRREEAMSECIQKLSEALETTGRPSIWSAEIKASEDVLEPLFRNFCKKLGLPPQSMNKGQFHQLIEYLDELDPEIVQKLDAIVQVAGQATVLETDA